MKTLQKNNSVLYKKYKLFKKLTKNKLKLKTTQKLIYSLSIFSIISIFGYMIFFISQSKKNESSITTKLFIIEKNSNFRKDH